jgi:hypothetical protein
MLLKTPLTAEIQLLLFLNPMNLKQEHSALYKYI